MTKVPVCPNCLHFEMSLFLCVMPSTSATTSLLVATLLSVCLRRQVCSRSGQQLPLISLLLKKTWLNRHSTGLQTQAILPQQYCKENSPFRLHILLTKARCKKAYQSCFLQVTWKGFQSHRDISLNFCMDIHYLNLMTYQINIFSNRIQLQDCRLYNCAYFSALKMNLLFHFTNTFDM